MTWLNFALFLTGSWVLLGALALFAFKRYQRPQDAPKTQRKQQESVNDWVSRADFDAAIQKLEQRIEWDLSEWYDKFSTLHARTAKRAQRANQQGGNGKSEQLEIEQPAARPSALHYRKPWSV